MDWLPGGWGSCVGRIVLESLRDRVVTGFNRHELINEQYEKDSIDTSRQSF